MLFHSSFSVEKVTKNINTKKSFNAFLFARHPNSWLNLTNEFANQKLLPTFAAGNFKPLLLKAMLRFKHGIT